MYKLSTMPDWDHMLCDLLGMPKKESQQIRKMLGHIIENGLLAYGKITIPGLGIVKVEREVWKGRGKFKGESFERTKLKLIPSENVKRRLDAGSQAFEDGQIGESQNTTTEV